MAIRNVAKILLAGSVAASSIALAPGVLAAKNTERPEGWVCTVAVTLPAGYLEAAEADPDGEEAEFVAEIYDVVEDLDCSVSSIEPGPENGVGQFVLTLTGTVGD